MLPVKVSQLFNQSIGFSYFKFCVLANNWASDYLAIISVSSDIFQDILLIRKLLFERRLAEEFTFIVFMFLPVIYWCFYIIIPLAWLTIFLFFFYMWDLVFHEVAAIVHVLIIVLNWTHRLCIFCNPILIFLKFDDVNLMLLCIVLLVKLCRFHLKDDALLAAAALAVLAAGVVIYFFDNYVFLHF